MHSHTHKYMFMYNHTYSSTSPVCARIHPVTKERFFGYSDATFTDTVPGVLHLFFLALPV